MLELMGSPASGVAWGTIGTFFSPIFQFLDDGIHLSNALQAGDITTAFNDLLDMPINSEMGQAIAQSIGWDDVGNQLANLASAF